MIGIVTVSLILLLFPNVCQGLSDKDVEMLIERVHALEIKEEKLKEEFEAKSLQFETKSPQLESEVQRLTKEVLRQDKEVEDLKMQLGARRLADNDCERHDGTTSPDKPTTQNISTKESDSAEINVPGDSDEQNTSLGVVIQQNINTNKTNQLDGNTNHNLDVLNYRNKKEPVFKFGPGPLVKKSVGIQEGPVAFHATTNQATESHFDKGQHIILDLVMLNIGGGYHEQHGVFITPKNGIYIFSASVLSSLKPHSEVQLQIVKDGTVLGRFLAYGDASYDQGSISVVTQLNTADEVWIEVWYPDTDVYFFGFRFTSFTGCLIAEL